MAIKLSKEQEGDDELLNHAASRNPDFHLHKTTWEYADGRRPVISRPSFASSAISSNSNSQALILKDENVGQDPVETAQLRKQRQP